MKPHPLLLPFAWLYGLGVLVRNKFFDLKIFRSHSVAAPVISVGNITAGGTGKTPIVEMLARQLLSEKKKIAIVSRGYGRVTSGFVVVANGKHIVASALEAGDEPFQLAKNLSEAVVLVDEQRVRGAQFACDTFQAEAIILDDGFQHRALHRDLDIVLIDSQASPFATHILPVGYRREQLSALRRADVIVITKVQQEVKVDALVQRIQQFTDAKIFTSSFEPKEITEFNSNAIVDVQELHKKKGISFCGIGQPKSFEQTLQTMQLSVQRHLVFPDHHRYDVGDFDELITAYTETHADYLITTEKDSMRLQLSNQKFSQLPVYVLKMHASIHNEDDWKRIVSSKINFV